MINKHYDVIIIGAGIVGCAAARALSRFRLDTLVLEREDDAACGATKANSGIVHAGYDCVPGTLKAELNVKGAALFRSLAEELDIPYRVNGSLVLCFDENDRPKLEELYSRGQKNGVSDLQIIEAEEARALEPNLSPKVCAALWAKNAAVISPYEAAVAFAENAAVNGVEFLFNTPVTAVIPNPENGIAGFTVDTPDGRFTAKTIVNAAGIDADSVFNNIANSFGLKTEECEPQRGQYYLLDNSFRGFVTRTLFQLPSRLGKGVLITSTADENILVGPNAEPLAANDRYDTQTTREGLSEVLEKAGLSVAKLPIHGRITAFSGIRAKHASEDFVINEPTEGFINALGIDSPGLSAAPAIGEKIAEMVTARLQPEINTNFNPKREGIKRFANLSFSEQESLIKENPMYGHVVCRCETVTEGEIVDAIRRPVGARNLDALKRRTRARMGRCQGGFCTIKLVEILSRELGVSEESLWK